MANIMINSNCNLKCKYCFANDFVNREIDDISIGNFQSAIDFIKRDTNKAFIGIVGGEPTLHPRINEILDIAINDAAVQDITVYSNGLLLERIMTKLKNPKVHVLINCNSAGDIGEASFEKMKQNIKTAVEENGMNEKIHLGINLYDTKMNIDYIFDLLEIAKASQLRISVTIPNNYSEIKQGAITRFSKMKSVTYDLIIKLLKNGITPYFDCNKIPVCLLNEKERKNLQELFGDKEISNIIGEDSTCSPVVDILQDLTAVRCFGLSEYLRVDIECFSDLNELKAYFENEIDIYAGMTYQYEKCSDCYERNVRKCYGACLCYKIERIEKMKKLIQKEQGGSL